MRADRLISIMLLLQARGRLTARQLAAELGVSERTIYRDIIALSAAGIPIYTEGGHGGGITLIEEYRATLTGLNPNEARALSMLAIPQPLVKLGVAPDLKSAMLKLSAALSVSARESETRARQRVLLDARWWFQKDEDTPHLQTIQQALWQDSMLEISHLGAFEVPISQVVAPLGLVAKTNIWYLVASSDSRIKVIAVARITAARILDGFFERPADFDLAGFWHAWCEEYEASRPHYTVIASVSPTLNKVLPKVLGRQPITFSSPPPEAQPGWQTVTLTFESFEDARSRILGLGSAIQVIEPLALRTSIMDFAEQTLKVYRA